MYLDERSRGRFTHTHEGNVNIEPEFFKNNLLKVINFWLHWVFIAVRRLSLVVASRGYPLVVACGLFVVVASFVEHKL